MGTDEINETVHQKLQNISDGKSAKETRSDKSDPTKIGFRV